MHAYKCIRAWLHVHILHICVCLSVLAVQNWPFTLPYIATSHQEGPGFESHMGHFCCCYLPGFSLWSCSPCAYMDLLHTVKKQHAKQITLLPMSLARTRVSTWTWPLGCLWRGGPLDHSLGEGTAGRDRSREIIASVETPACVCVLVFPLPACVCVCVTLIVLIK